MTYFLGIPWPSTLFCQRYFQNPAKSNSFALFLFNSKFSVTKWIMLLKSFFDILFYNLDNNKNSLFQHNFLICKLQNKIPKNSLNSNIQYVKVNSVMKRKRATKFNTKTGIWTQYLENNIDIVLHCKWVQANNRQTNL